VAAAAVTSWSSTSSTSTHPQLLTDLTAGEMPPPSARIPDHLVRELPKLFAAVLYLPLPPTGAAAVIADAVFTAMSPQGAGNDTVSEDITSRVSASSAAGSTKGLRALGSGEQRLLAVLRVVGLLGVGARSSSQRDADHLAAAATVECLFEHVL
jgi:hypothetical protein